ncbi:MAG TPA: ATP-binding protein [Thermoanaerobaculia bacterium]|nr:ATP-binding protein [Thermoanaerobaculia bacterium]
MTSREDLERELAETREHVRTLRRALARRGDPPDTELRGGVSVGLSEREALLADAERIAHLGSWVWNVGPDTVFWSNELFRILGYHPDRDEASSQAFFARVHPDDLERVTETAQRGVETGIAERIHYRVLHPDGSIRHVQMDGAMIFDHDGSLRRAVGTVLDVTEQVRLQQRLASAEKLEAIGRLAGGVAHDLNNLMMVVSAISSQLEREAPAAAGELQHAVEAASLLTQRLLSVSGRAQLEPQPMACNDLVAEALEKMVVLLGDRVALVDDLQAESAELEVDSHQMELALLNLLINARDAVTDGGTIVVRTRLLDQDEVEIGIEDDGAGMSADVEARAFEPFFTTKGEGRGTGLGLALARGTVERHGGAITLDTRPGCGTRITIRLPCRRLAKCEGAKSVREQESAARLRVLIVDDEPLVRGALRRLLEAEGHSVEEASCPSECLALAAHHSRSLDLLVCDLVMPEMLGPALVAELRERRTCPGRVLFVTGYGSSAESMLQPGDVVLAKPFRPQDLRSAIVETTAAARER